MPVRSGQGGAGTGTVLPPWRVGQNRHPGRAWCSWRPPHRRAWPRQALVEDFADRVGAINVPVLLVPAGSDDTADPPQILREDLLPLIPTATLAEFGGTGHLAAGGARPLEVPDHIASCISAFIARL
ncbi:alpha/beta fold hydrolase [Streptomyces lydicamycinicus]